MFVFEFIKKETGVCSKYLAAFFFKMEMHDLVNPSYNKDI